MIDRELAEHAWRASLWRYAEALSGRRWKPFGYLRYIADTVSQAVLEGSARIVVSVPPRHGKSELLSHWMPTWFLDWFPSRRVILTSYGDSLAADWGAAVRNELLTNELTVSKPDGAFKKVSDWRTSEGGGMRTAGVGGPITGRGGDLIIVDDPHKSWAEVQSATYRRHVIDWFNATLYSRAEPNASIIVIQTRWHERDLVGYLLNEHADTWTDIRLPAIAEPGDILGRCVGEALCPERYSIEDLEKIKAAMGSIMFSGLYQQAPSSFEGSMVKAASIKRARLTEDIKSRCVVGVDLAISTSDLADYTTAVAVNCVDGQWYTLKADRIRAGFHGVIEWIQSFCEPLNPAVVGIEQFAYQAAVVQELLLRSSLTVKAMNPGRRDKVARFQPVAARYEAGLVTHAHDLPSAYTDELLAFPSGEHDDWVDATAYAHEAFIQRFQSAAPLAFV